MIGRVGWRVGRVVGTGEHARRAVVGFDRTVVRVRWTIVQVSRTVVRASWRVARLVFAAARGGFGAGGSHAARGAAAGRKGSPQGVGPHNARWPAPYGLLPGSINASASRRKPCDSALSFCSGMAMSVRKLAREALAWSV